MEKNISKDTLREEFLKADGDNRQLEEAINQLDRQEQKKPSLPNTDQAHEEIHKEEADTRQQEEMVAQLEHQKQNAPSLPNKKSVRKKLRKRGGTRQLEKMVDQLDRQQERKAPSLPNKNQAREEFRKEGVDTQQLEKMVAQLDRQLQKKCYSLSKADREDIRQDALYALCKAKKLGKSIPYMLKAVENRAMTFFRQEERILIWESDEFDAHFSQNAPLLSASDTETNEDVALLVRFAYFLDFCLRHTPTHQAYFRLFLLNAKPLFGARLSVLYGSPARVLPADALYQPRCRLSRKLPKLQQTFLQREGLHGDHHAVYLLVCFCELLLDKKCDF